MALNYERIGWENAPSTNTPLDAANLNHMDNGILAVSTQYDTEVPYLQQQVAGIPAMLDTYLAEEIGADVTAWLDAHVTPGGSTIVVDDTLGISGAAADAAKCGEVKNAFNNTRLVSVASAERTKGTLSSSSWAYTSNSAYQHIAIPVNGGEKLEIIGCSAEAVSIGVLTSYSGTGTVPQFCSSAPFDSTILIKKNNCYSFNLPSDARYVIYIVLLNNVDTSPKSLKINGFECCETARDSICGIEDSLDAKIGDINLSSIGKWQKGYGYPTLADGWVQTNENYIHVVLPVKSGDVVDIDSSAVSNSGGRIAVLSDYTGYTGTPSFSATSPFANSIALGVNTNYRYTMPSDAKYILFLLKANAYNCTPRKFEINQYDYCKSAFENFNEHTELINRVQSVNCANLTKPYEFYTDKTGDVTFTWDADRHCTVAGTAYSGVFQNFVNTTGLPENMFEGKAYFVRYKTTDTKIQMVVLCNNASNTNLKTYYFTEDGYFWVPTGTAKIVCRLMVTGATGGNAVNGVVTEYGIYSYKPIMYGDIYEHKAPKIIVFKDDDTANDTSIQRYIDNCKHNGIVGTIVTITGRITQEIINPDILVQAEKDGFSVICHCNQQLSDDYWTQGHLDPQLQREDMATVINVMKNTGLINYMYWQTPGGVYNEDILKLCKSYGFKALGTISTGYAEPAVNHIEDIKRYYLVTYSMKETDPQSGIQTLANAKGAIDALASSNGGLIILTTHFHTWTDLQWDDTLDENGYPIGYARFNELAQYAVNSGCQIMNYANAIATLDKYFTD